MRVDFVMALGGVPVIELFNDARYWQRTRVPWLFSPLRPQQKGDCGKARKVVQVLFRGDVIEVVPPNHISISPEGGGARQL